MSILLPVLCMSCSRVIGLHLIHFTMCHETNYVILSPQLSLGYFYVSITVYGVG